MSDLELVLVTDRTVFEKAAEYSKSGIDGVSWLDWDNIPKNAPMGFLPRQIIDAKKTGTDIKRNLDIAHHFPQLISYVIIIDDKTDTILTYQRKGKEVGLQGKASIGVGGHIDVIDAILLASEGEEYCQDIHKVVLNATKREILEEIGIEVDHLGIADLQYLINTNVDVTAMGHLGISGIVYVDKDQLRYDESEYLNVRWLTHDELFADAQTKTYEPWSQLMIDAIVQEPAYPSDSELQDVDIAFEEDDVDINSPFEEDDTK